MSDYQPLLIRFRGICAHLDLKNGASPEKKRKRTLLLRHRNGNSNIEHHVPYIECLADDVLEITPGLRMLQYSRPGTDGRFARIDLEDRSDTVTIVRINEAPSGEVTEDVSYEENVPHFAKILNKANDAVPAASLLMNSPLQIDAKFATAVFDMPEGTLVAGEPEAMKTRFDSGPAKDTERRYSRWSDLYVQNVPKGKVTVELDPRSNGQAGEKQVITFADTVRMITIGNEPERLIVGLIGGADAHAGHDHNHGTGNGNGNGRGPIQPTGHFILYYDILKNQPDEMPMPVPSQLEGTGCPNNNYP
jgi:hypothetical protein